MPNTDTLYVSDLDGTLLGTDSLVSPTSAAIISDLCSRGAMITVATARTPATVVPLLRHTGISMPAIVMTGAATWSIEQGRFIQTHILDSADASLAVETVTRHGITPFIYTTAPAGSPLALEVYHSAKALNHMERNFVDARADMPLKRFYLDTPMPPGCSDRVMLIFGMGEIDRIQAAADDLTGRTGCYVSHYPDIFDPSAGLIEIYAPGVSKAAAMRRLAKECGAKRTVAFGDNLNDIPMLEAADVAVAMGNAQPQVKEIADIVTDANYTDSVARFIAQDFRHHIK